LSYQKRSFSVHFGGVLKFAEFTQRFAAKLLQDVEAAVAAKRSMYRRGKFDLLRQRVLYACAA
jgi:hypothetical protein